MTNFSPETKWTGINPKLLIQLTKNGYLIPNESQVNIWKTLNTTNHNIIVAPTGRGKTLVLIIYLLNYLAKNPKHQAFFLLPTKELVQQVYSQTQKLNNLAITLTRLTAHTTLAQLAQSQLLITTPQKLRSQQVNLNKFKTHKKQLVVLDEVDCLIELNFLEDVKLFLKSQQPYLVKKIATSATVRKGLMHQLKILFKNPDILIDQSGKINQPQHTFLIVRDENKFASFVKVLTSHPKEGGTIVFLNTKNDLFKLANQLKTQSKLKFVVFHGDLPATERKRLMTLIKHNEQVVILTTDLLARGISLQQLQNVINYQIPKEKMWYIHRAGRTGRYQQPGTVINLVTDYELSVLKKIVQNNFSLQEIKLKTNKLVSKKPFTKSQPLRLNPDLEQEIAKIKVQSLKKLKPNYKKVLKSKIDQVKRNFRSRWQKPGLKVN